MILKMVRVVGVVLSLWLVAGCGDSRSETGAGRLSVVATTTVVTDLVRNVGGDLISVYDVIQPNVDPHDFEPSARDLTQMRKAAVIVESGAGLERWLDKTIKASQTQATLVIASEGVTLRHSDDGSEPDPHIWHDPRNVGQMVANIANGFATADPVHAADYQRNAAQYQQQLMQLDAEITAQINTLANKKLVTNHDAFGYYIDHYGLQFVGSVIPSFETSAELSAAEVDDLVRKIKAEHVKAVFTENALPAKIARTIANEAGVKVVAGNDALFGDGLGTSKSVASTYLDMMRHNTSVIVTNLR